MDTTLSTARLDPVVPTYPVARFTAEQYLAMIRAEILTEEDKVELINGMITPMSPAGEDHTWCVINLTSLLADAMRTHFLAVQGTVRVGDSEVFDPDLALVRQRGGSQRKAHPVASDIDLVIEVALTSLRKDRTTKTAAYAAAGIPEYWVADIATEQLWVHRDPSADSYQTVTARGRDEVISPLAFPELTVAVRRVFA
ncbi:MAG: Uma2 family endonuclease [Lacipirellulaceae bacterium]